MFVARRSSLVARTSEQMGGQGGCCALAVGSGNTDYLCGTQLKEDVYLGRNKFVVSTGQFEKLIVARHGGIGYDDVGLLKISRVVRAEMKFYIMKLFELLYRIA